MLNGPRASWDATGRMKYAGRRPQQTFRSQQWENNVGGTNSHMTAAFGSTDRAKDDHRNDALCKVVTRELTVTSEPRRIDREFTSTWDNVETYTPPTVEQIEVWARRAERMGITVDAYARDVLKLPVR